MKKTIFLIIISAILIPLIYGVSFTSNPNIITNPATKDTTIECRWTANDASSQNQTWYNGSEASAYTDNDGSPAFLPSGIASRGEIWTCVVSLHNSTSNITLNDSVIIGNARPTKPVLYLSGIDQGNSTTIYEDTTYNFDVNSSDSDGDNIEYSENGPFSINSNTGTFSWTPDYDYSTSNITFTVTDDYSVPEVNILKVEFVIVYVNDSPIITSSSENKTATENTQFYYYLTVSDEENDPSNFSLNYSKVNGDGSLSSLILNKMSGSQANLTFNRASKAPTYSERGNYSVSIIAYDETNTSRNDSIVFNLEILPLNQQPNLTLIPNASGTQGNLFTLQINSSDADADDSSSFSISALSCDYSNPWSISTSNSSNNGTGLINLTLNNTHVLCPDVLITVTDSQGASDSQTVNFNITNSNDAPEIFDYSSTSSNSGGNNLTNLSGANGAQFTYSLNYSDIDSLTYEGEILTIKTNNSLFSFNNNGLMNFTINDSLVGNWSVLVNVTDDEGLYDEKIMIFEFVNNTVPTIINISQNFCQEDILCTVYVDAYDPDLNENLSFESNSSMFNLTFFNESSAIMQATFDNNHVGSFYVEITVTDSLGASSNRTFLFTVNNTNDPPIIDGDQNNVADNISIGLIVETFNYHQVINFSDEDLIHGDVLTINWTVIAGNNSVFNATKTGSNEATINFTPQVGEANDYLINFTVKDSANNTAYQVLNFTIFPKSRPPVINNIRPYNNSGTTVFSLGENTFGNSVGINFSENRSITFDINATDPDGDDLTYTWLLDRENNGSSTPNTIYFNFASSGTHTVNVTVQDEYYETVSFQWNVVVDNLNRDPQLLNNLANLTGASQINGTESFFGYFSLFDNTQRFYDADDDSNQNFKIDGNETFSLTVTASECVDQVLDTVATLSIDGAKLTVDAEKIGECVVSFNATDADGSIIISNNVTINVSEVSQNEGGGDTTTVTTTTSSGTRTRTETVVIPLTEEVDSPTPLKIIAPGEVVIYDDQLIEIPIVIKSNWTETLYGISLIAESNNSEITMNLSQNFWNTLGPGLSQDIVLSVTNFREGGPYEILLTANIESPEYSDQELILVNSIEAAGDGETYKTKIAFARDFFNENKECQELNEVLNQAQTSANNNDYLKAIEYVDAAINGCKYLVSQSANPETQNPSLVRSFREFTKEHAVEVIIGSSALMIVALGIFFTRKNVFE